MSFVSSTRNRQGGYPAVIAGVSGHWATLARMPRHAGRSKALGLSRDARRTARTAAWPNSLDEAKAAFLGGGRH